MNSRFKFRVWDKVSKRYFYLELKFGDNGYHPDFITDPVFEQCTGLKDKNGNLIYEGDIVQYSFGRKGIVSFGKYTGCFAAGWENINIDLIGWYLDDYYEPDNCGRLRINLDDTHDSITEEDATDFEIISNIHEQAEQKD